MNNPNQPPSSRIEAESKRAVRFMHSALAFLSGLVILPASIFTYVTFYLGGHNVSVNSLWGGCFFGGLLAGAAVFPFKRIPYWLAIVLGTISAWLIVVLAQWLGKYVA